MTDNPLPPRLRFRISVHGSGFAFRFRFTVSGSPFPVYGFALRFYHWLETKARVSSLFIRTSLSTRQGELRGPSQLPNPAFLKIYQKRSYDLIRLATGGTGVLPEGDIPQTLVERLANEASKTAAHILNICIRVLDYCPPMDIMLGEYVRALITADYDHERCGSTHHRYNQGTR